MKKKKVAILAGTLARAEQLKNELGIAEAITLTTHGNNSPGRGLALSTILVDGTARWGDEIRASFSSNTKVYWIEPVLA